MFFCGEYFGSCAGESREVDFFGDDVIILEIVLRLNQIGFLFPIYSALVGGVA